MKLCYSLLPLVMISGTAVGGCTLLGPPTTQAVDTDSAGFTQQKWPLIY